MRSTMPLIIIPLLTLCTAGASDAGDRVPNMTQAEWRAADRLRAEPGRGRSAADPGGMQVRARWTSESGQIVRDERE